MKAPILKRVSQGEIKGWMREEILDQLPPTFFDESLSSIQKMGGKLIKRSKWRWAAIFSLSDGRRIFFKRDCAKGWAESLKYLFLPTKGEKEFLIASRLERKDLNLPKPLGWVKRVQRGLVKESYFLSEAIGEGVSFIEEVKKSRESLSVIELANLVKKFQDAGLFHQDLHAGNFLWDGASLFLTDLHHAKMVKLLSQNRRLWNLAHLLHSLRSMWGEREQLQFLDQYFKESPNESRKKEILFQRIYLLMNRLQTKQWRSRTKRCLMDSSEFTVQREKGIRTFRRRDFPMDRLKKMMKEHQALIREKPSCLIKHSPKVIVSILNDEGERICLKQFCYPHVWGRVKEHFRRSKGLKSWVAANGMRTRGIPTLKPLALIEKKSWSGLKESTLFMEALANDLEMDRYVLKGFEDLNKKRLFIKTFAHWLNGLHRMGLYHQDMKTCNILVSERGEAWDFHLLDFEDIRMGVKMNWKKLFRNFLQLNTSTPKAMTKTDRFKFFREYLLLNPMIKDQKSFIRKLMVESRRRGVVYVSAEGVVTETMK